MPLKVDKEGRWGVLHGNLVLSTWLMMWIGHGKAIGKLTFFLSLPIQGIAMTYFHKEMIHQLKSSDIHFKTILPTSRLRRKQTIHAKEKQNKGKDMAGKENRGGHGCHFLAVHSFDFRPECAGIKTRNLLVCFPWKIALVLHYTFNIIKVL